MPSLGTLTIDLITRTAGWSQGLSKAERDSAKFRRQVERDMKKVRQDLARGLKIGAAAASAAITALTVDTVRSAKELQMLAQVAGTGTTEFQKYAAGARRVGIEQDKLADIFKDTSDKVGDFLQTGGGPLADFFENIAPQIGVTAEQFRNLSGPQALELYVSSLEKANLSNSEMTFFLEAIASDATALLPLLKNNAEGFREYGDEAERAGAILGEDVLASAQMLDDRFESLRNNFDATKTQIAAQLLPTIGDLSGAFDQLTIEQDDAKRIAEGITGVIKGLATGAAVATATVQTLGKGIGTFAAVIAAIPDGFDAAAQAAREGSIDIRTNLEDAAQRVNDIWDSTGNQLGRQLEGAEDINDELTKTGNKSAENLSLTESMRKEKERIAKEQAKIAKEEERARIEAEKVVAALQQRNIDEFLQKQEQYSDLVKALRTDQEVINDTLKERLSIIENSSSAFMGGQDETTRRTVAAAFTQAPSFGGLDATIGGAASELNRIGEAEQQLNDWYALQLEMLATFRADRADLMGLWNEQEAMLTMEHQANLARIEQARQLASLQAAENLFGNLADVTRQFAGEQSAAYQVLFAIEKAAAIARSIIAIQTGIAQAAATPFPGNLAAIASVIAATGGIVSTIQSTSIQGQAHAGMDRVPTTGTYLLERGERVVTAETSAKLDRTLDDVRGGGAGSININNYLGEQEFASMMASRPGEQVMNNYLRKNQRLVQQLSRGV